MLSSHGARTSLLASANLSLFCSLVPALSMSHVSFSSFTFSLFFVFSIRKTITLYLCLISYIYDINKY